MQWKVLRLTKNNQEILNRRETLFPSFWSLLQLLLLKQHYEYITTNLPLGPLPRWCLQGSSKNVGLRHRAVFVLVTWGFKTPSDTEEQHEVFSRALPASLCGGRGSCSHHDRASLWNPPLQCIIPKYHLPLQSIIPECNLPFRDNTLHSWSVASQAKRTCLLRVWDPYTCRPLPV